MSLAPFFQPRRIAILGASADKVQFGNLALRNLRNHGSTAVLHVIHPSAASIDGIPCHRSLLDLPQAPDLCVIGVRADQVLAAVAECVELRVPAATIVAAGFAELGTPEGKAMQVDLDRLRASSGLRIIGPNTLGVASFATGAVSIASGNIPAAMRPGPVAIVTQSGGVALSIMLRGIEKGLGFSHVVAVGNESDVSVAETIAYLAARDEVGIVLCYMEGVRDVAALRQAIGACLAAGKPVMLLKGGQTRAGQRATASHTGALAGSARVWRSVLEQLGGIHAESVEHMVATAVLFSRHGVSAARAIGTFAVGGGLTVLFTDLLDQHGIRSAELAPATAVTIQEALPDVTAHNPCDMGGLYLSGDGSRLRTALAAMAADAGVDALAIGYCPVITEREQVIGGSIARAITGLAKPVVVLSYEARPDCTAHQWFREAGAAVIDEPVAGVQAMRAWMQFRPRPANADGAATDPMAVERRQRTRKQLASLAATGRHVVLEDEAKALLADYGLAAPPERVVRSEDDTAAAAAALGFPLALKVLASGMTHRGVGHGVLLGLRDESELRAAWRQLSANARGLADVAFLVQRMAPAGDEFLLGASRDADMGLVLAASEGGARAEASTEAFFCAIPCAPAELARRLAEWAPARRARAPAAAGALLAAAVAVSTFLEDAADAVQELDVNPVIVPAAGGPAVAVDGLLILRGAAASE